MPSPKRPAKRPARSAARKSPGKPIDIEQAGQKIASAVLQRLASQTAGPISWLPPTGPVPEQPPTNLASELLTDQGQRRMSDATAKADELVDQITDRLTLLRVRAEPVMAQPQDNAASGMGALQVGVGSAPLVAWVDHQSDRLTTVLAIVEDMIARMVI